MILHFIQKKAFHILSWAMIAACFLGASPSQAGNSVTYVDWAAGNDQYDGTSYVFAGGLIGPKRSIKAGVQSTDAGGTCYVAPGVYREGVINLKKSIKLIGAGADQTIIAARQPTTILMTVEHSEAVVANFKFQNGQAGLVITNCSPLICNNVITGAIQGIVVYQNAAQAPSIVNNTICHNKNAGIYLVDDASAVIMNNILYKNGSFGIRANNPSVTISYNDVSSHTRNFPEFSVSTGNFSLPPGFVSENDFHLLTHSPCVNKGHPDSAFNDLGGSRNDLGAFGGEGMFWAKMWRCYQPLIDHDKVATVLNLDAERYEILCTAIKEREFNNTANWSELDDQLDYYVAKPQVTKIWLRRAASALYHEVNHTFNWTLLDLSQTDLFCMLGLILAQPNQDMTANWSAVNQTFLGPYFLQLSSYVFFFDKGVWTANPLQAEAVVNEIINLYHPQTPEEALYSILEYIRSLGWYHVDVAEMVYGFDWMDVPCHAPITYNINAVNYDLIFKYKGTECHTMVMLLQETARAFNIPAVVGTDVPGGAHAAIQFPSVGLLIAHGDDAFDTVYSMPAKHTFIDVNWYTENLKNGMCELKYNIQKNTILTYFSYYQDPLYGDDVMGAYFWYDQDQNNSSSLWKALHNPFNNDCPQKLIDDPEIQQWLTILDGYLDAWFSAYMAKQ
jgi:parallel beta-helix repeat protein